MKARTGLEAIEKIKSKLEENTCCTKYAVIFMDINMPIMGGLEATAKIRELENQFPVKNNEKKSIIIAQTAALNEEFDIKSKPENLGFDGIVEKPIGRDAFEAIIRKYVL